MPEAPPPIKRRVILFNAEQVAHIEKVDRELEAKGIRLDCRIGPRDIGGGHFISVFNGFTNPKAARHIPFLMTLPHCDVLIQDPADDDGEQTITIVPGSIFTPDHKPRVYQIPKGANPWDVPPLPPYGDWSEVEIYASVGRALSQWELFEIAFADLFAAFLTPSTYSLPAQRAYGSIVTSRGRVEMVRAAGTAYFAAMPSKEHELAFDDTCKAVRNFGARRNEIAHGIVSAYSATDGPVRGLALVPPRYASNKLTLNASENPMRFDPSEHPKYAYTSVEINYFADRFQEMAKPTYRLADSLYRYFSKEDLDTLAKLRQADADQELTA